MDDLPIMAPRTDTCFCTVCRFYFNPEAAFDKHRVGDYPTETHPTNTRRCLTPAEMLALGMGVNSRGRWVTRLWDSGAQARMELAV